MENTKLTVVDLDANLHPEKEAPRPVHKIAEHLTDAQFHMANVEGLTNFERSEFMRLCNEAWGIIKGRKV